MTHDEATPLLLDLALGTLAPDERTALETHLAACEECRVMRRTVERLVVAVREETSDAGHPDADAIVAFALGGSSGAGEAAVAEHVACCAACAAEVDAVRRAEAESREEALAGDIRRAPGGGAREGARTAPRATSRRAWGALAAAAAGLAALLAYPAYLGLVRLPVVEDQSADAAREAQSLSTRVGALEGELGAARDALARVHEWGGATPLQLLSGAMRGGEEARTVRVDPAQPVVALAVELGALPESAAATLVRFAITRADGGPAFAADLAADDVRRELREAGVVLLLVPSARLAPGSYRLAVTLDAEAGARRLLVLGFAARTAPASP